ncbi:low molecular weight phosphatase family protein [Herbiconiux sp. KACC 21604]|uniref:arsenate reductase/protein-tyrosine-phosphatase family protein n=1 Tax=unclassified Herbiconiux TaxID=2618217 RepID=UPI001490E45E|nr:low molecular weight phosphatase family protein [Herbiconiux sp. SALV-R1]QJU54589.1 low molecular weight phosphatase family protein [Herbiconiux sp. SALV-R1]WPO85675.1 low molecular weight phosphatase family protein [Herbiconiux sp. KACC 21604]
MDQIRVLTVCSGNICRSPLAELMIAEGVQDIPGISVSSAGTVARDGDPMPEPAQALAHQFGVDPGSHQARYLTEPIVDETDLVLALSRSHRSQAVQLAPSKIRRAFTIREFARLAETLPDDEIRAAAVGDSLRDRLDGVLQRLMAQKAVIGPPALADDDDVIDPYRRDEATYQQSGAEIAPAVAQVVRALRLIANPAGALVK